MSTTADAQYNAEKAVAPIKLLVNNMQSTGLRFKPWVFIGVHWALNSVSKGLTGNLQGHYTPYLSFGTRCQLQLMHSIMPRKLCAQ